MNRILLLLLAAGAMCAGVQADEGETHMIIRSAAEIPKSGLKISSELITMSYGE